MRRINERFWYDKDARVVRICNEYIALAKTHTEGKDLAAELNAVMRLWCNEPFSASTAIGKKLERVYETGRSGDRHRPKETELPASVRLSPAQVRKAIPPIYPAPTRATGSRDAAKVGAARLKLQTRENIRKRRTGDLE